MGGGQTRGVYGAESLRSQGFIHCSTVEQVVQTANRFYRGRADLVLLCIDEALLESEIRYEEGEPGQQFPHIYGPLNLESYRQRRRVPARRRRNLWASACVSQREG